MPSEFDLIARYFSPPTAHTLLAGGDDAALIAPSAGMELAVSTDMLVAGRHFFADADPRAVGHKALAVNLSDMAAMGAAARWATLSLALAEADEQWLAEFAGGFLDLAREHDVDLIGGDTTRGPLNICVQIMGEVPAGRALRRSGARAGDSIWLSGTALSPRWSRASTVSRTSVSHAMRPFNISKRVIPMPYASASGPTRPIARASGGR